MMRLNTDRKLILASDLFYLYNMKFIVKIIITTLAVLLTAWLLPETWVKIDGWIPALIVALVLAFLNQVVRPIMVFLTIPATLFTLGLFLLAINAFIIMIADYFVKGFHVYGFWKALAFSLILSIATAVLEGIRKHDETPRD
ncbi:MAG: phage holin family protein [Bacteroidia bacterium]